MTMRHTHRRLLIVLAILAVLALLLLACGPADSGSEAAAETPSVAADTAATAVPTTAPLDSPQAADTAEADAEPLPPESPVAVGQSTSQEDNVAATDSASSADGATTQTGDGDGRAGSTVATSLVPPTSQMSVLAGVQSAMWAANVTVAVGDGSFNYSANGYPAHELPDEFLVPADGNTPPFDITEEYEIVASTDLLVISPIDVSITLTPTYSNEVTLTDLGTIGVMISGVPMFNDYEDMNRQFVAVDDNLSLNGAYFIDSCNGHPLADGTQYHYHGVPYCVTDLIDVPGQHSTIIGFALDGFPIYGSKDAGGAEIGDAQLDECSGHYGSTPEFPDGIYHYHLTEDAAPYSIDCFHGEIEYSGSGPGGPPPGADVEGGPGGAAGPGGERPEGPPPGQGEGAAGSADGAPGPQAPAPGDASSAPAAGPSGGAEGEGETAPAGGEGRPDGTRPDFAAAAATLGITEEELRAALGGPPPDFDAAATTLGISSEQLQSALDAATS